VEKKLSNFVVKGHNHCKNWALTLAVDDNKANRFVICNYLKRLKILS